jgi:hypothetical protein
MESEILSTLEALWPGSDIASQLWGSLKPSTQSFYATCVLKWVRYAKEWDFDASTPSV